MIKAISALQAHDHIALLALAWLTIFGGFEWLTHLSGHLLASALTFVVIVLTGIAVLDDATDLVKAGRRSQT